MAFLLFLLEAGMYFYLRNLKPDSISLKWFRLFYFSQMVWQLSDMFRYSIHPDLIGSIGYKVWIIIVGLPIFCVLMVAYVQFLYHFLDDTFPKERKVILYVMIIVAVFTCGLNFWNEIYNNSNLDFLNLIGFSYGLIFNIWICTVCMRKTYKLKNKMPEASRANKYMGLNILLFISSGFAVVLFGFFSPLGYWSFFLLIWLGNLIQIVIFIDFGAVYVNFKYKLIGFNFVIVLSVLIVLTLTLYPPRPTDIAFSESHQNGLFKLLLIIIFSILIIFFIYPKIILKTLTAPIQKLLTGVQQVNSGNLNAQVNVKQADEIGNLSENFNLMTNTIRKTHNRLAEYAENLEEQVAERTSEILQQNTKIAKQRDDLVKLLTILNPLNSSSFNPKKWRVSEN
jgi:HAMP domain-containing protein